MKMDVKKTFREGQRFEFKWNRRIQFKLHILARAWNVVSPVPFDECKVASPIPVARCTIPPISEKIETKLHMFDVSSVVYPGVYRIDLNHPPLQETKIAFRLLHHLLKEDNIKNSFTSMTRDPSVDLATWHMNKRQECLESYKNISAFVTDVVTNHYSDMDKKIQTFCSLMSDADKAILFILFKDLMELRAKQEGRTLSHVSLYNIVYHLKELCISRREWMQQQSTVQANKSGITTSSSAPP